MSDIFNHKNAIEYIEKLNKERVQILRDRQDSYAPGESFSDNFINAALILNGLGIHISPSDVSTVLFVLKIVRAFTAKNAGVQPRSDARYDSVLDAMNYLDLGVICEMQGADIPHEDIGLSGDNTLSLLQEEMNKMNKSNEVDPMTKENF